MPNTRYPKACYEKLKNLDDGNRLTWVTSVKYDFSQILLNKFGFNYIWFSQYVDNEEIFLNVLKSKKLLYQ